MKKLICKLFGHKPTKYITKPLIQDGEDPEWVMANARFTNWFHGHGFQATREWMGCKRCGVEL